MPRIALPVPLSAEARNTLDEFVHAASTPQLLALHGRIVLAAADGSNNQQIDAAPRVPPVTAGKWRQAFAIRIEGLRDAPRSRRPPKHLAEIRHQVQTRVCRQPLLAVLEIEKKFAGSGRQDLRTRGQSGFPSPLKSATTMA